ncbi:FMN-dependent L-lactate dehydrogenase LldD [Cocleimonas flava]|uniref:L-lactate dehydrogenase (Cytochrome) n=1 Tax=Cocleimonas flava TaxID=634765 RepID=A0A4R1ET60_9GAMM|nr:alpha-hydroxy acid oxidase [Cocleimonas flava]TCJ84806.1 L-lactate dehydrogenase (cytochrome) [Cocleimonas flava]
MVQALIRKSACVADLKKRAKRRIPKFAFDYIEGGCNSELALKNNREGLDSVFLRPEYLQGYSKPELGIELFGKHYSAPIGIAPLGLTGLIWPDASAMHARSALKANIPFVLSTVSTISIEDAAKNAEDNFWFQLYPPADEEILNDMLDRLRAVGCQNLVVTVDVPTPSRRISSIKSGLAVPPKITIKSVLESAIRPIWSLATVRAGLPRFATLHPYIKDAKNIEDISNFIRVTLKDVVDETTLKTLRDKWQGNLIVKSISHEDDAIAVKEIGVDGIIVSNHGGRQLDASLPPAETLEEIINAVGSDLTVMADSGVETGVDIARYLALGAEAVFAGRAFLYGVGAHGELGAEHTIDLLRDELEQVMSQLHCSKPELMHQYLE